MKAKRSNLGLSGFLWLNRDENRYLASDRIELLEKIDDLGSITKAAKAVGISYKTAWETVNEINTVSEKPMVNRLTGGKGGGGTTLTPEAKKVIQQFKAVQEEHRKFLGNLENKMGDASSRYRFDRSARNKFQGNIAKITRGPQNAEVVLTTAEGASITAVIPNRAVDSHRLEVGSQAMAVVKASSILIGTDLHNANISARNVFCGNIARLVEGPVNTEVEVQIGPNFITSLITHDSAQRLGLRVGGHACVVFKASSVIIDTD